MNPYQKEDARLRLIFHKAKGCSDVDAIARAAQCSLGDAWRIHLVREHASGVLLDAWARELMPWRKLWRLVTDDPFDCEAQVRASKHRKTPARGQKKTAAARISVVDELRPA